MFENEPNQQVSLENKINEEDLYLKFVFKIKKKDKFKKR
jgi:hypothetical protein